MQDPARKPAPHPRKDEIFSRAWAEALAMARGGADHARRPQGELVATALSAHRLLSRGHRQSIAVTALGPDSGARGFAAFVAVYAAQREQRDDHGREAAAGGRTPL